MSDNNKKCLFKKFNFLDLFIILIVVCAVAFSVVKFTSATHSDFISGDDKITYVLKVKAVRQVSADAFHVGDGIYDTATDDQLGIVKSVEKMPAKEYINLADGSLTEQREIPDKFDVYITVECDGKISDDGYYLNGNQQVSNLSTLNIYTKFIKCNGQIISIIEE